MDEKKQNQYLLSYFIDFEGCLDGLFQNIKGGGLVCVHRFLGHPRDLKLMRQMHEHL